MTTRIHTLDRLSEIVIDGVVTRKLDFLGTVFIHDRHYFNVFRRYNSAYEIVLEDAWGDFHFHRNYTVRESIQRIMCYTDEAISELYSRDVVAFKNQAPVYEQVVDMRWSEIQGRFAGAAIRLVGVPNEYVKERVEESPNSYHAVPPPLEYGNEPSDSILPFESPDEPLQESQLDWGDTPSPNSSGHYSACYAPKKEQVEIPRGTATRRNLSDRFSEVENASNALNEVPNEVSNKTSMENFPEFKILRNGKKIRNTIH